MDRVGVLITFLTFMVLSEAQHEPGHCAFYEECGKNPLIDIALVDPFIPCLNYSRARPLSGEHYKKLQQVCPMLDRGESNTFACCSLKQLRSLEQILLFSTLVLDRCPSCVENYAHAHCINTCSPDQSQIVRVTKVLNVTDLGRTNEAVVGYESYLTSKFAEAAFHSCRNVRIPVTGDLAINALCGSYGANLCTPKLWYEFQGDSTAGLVPFDVDFKLIKEGDPTGVPIGVIPYNGRVLRCSETTPSGGQACSCQDCPESCPMESQQWEN